MHVAHPTSRKATGASVVTGVYGAQLPDIDDPHARVVRYLVEGA